MNIHVWKNAVLLAAAMALWLVLIAVELLTGYSGAFMQAALGLTLFALLVALWLLNRPALEPLRNPVLEFVCCGALAFALTGVFVLVAVVIGVQFRRLLEGLIH